MTAATLVLVLCTSLGSPYVTHVTKRIQYAVLSVSPNTTNAQHEDDVHAAVCRRSAATAHASLVMCPAASILEHEYLQEKGLPTQTRGIKSAGIDGQPTQQLEPIYTLIAHNIRHRCSSTSKRPWNRPEYSHAPSSGIMDYVATEYSSSITLLRTCMNTHVCRYVQGRYTGQDKTGLNPAQGKFQRPDRASRGPTSLRCHPRGGCEGRRAEETGGKQSNRQTPRQQSLLMR